MNTTQGKTFKMIAKTMFGLEEVLAKELEAIGAENIENFVHIPPTYVCLSTTKRTRF